MQLRKGIEMVLMVVNCCTTEISMFMFTLHLFFKLDFIREDDICMYEVLFLFECSISYCREKMFFLLEM